MVPLCWLGAAAIFDLVYIGKNKLNAGNTINQYKKINICLLSIYNQDTVVDGNGVNSWNFSLKLKWTQTFI